MAPISKLKVSGPALAALMQQMTLAPRDFDGLILGRFDVKSVSALNDTDEEQVVESREAYATGFCCSSSTCSFYSAGGAVDEDSLATLAKPFRDAVLGWLVFRQSTWLEHSMREAAVCAALPSALAALRAADPPAGQGSVSSSSSLSAACPLLFAVCSTQADHNGATVSFDYRFFQQLHVGGADVLQPVALEVTNMGAGAGRGYEGLPLRTPFARVPSPFRPASAAPSTPGMQTAPGPPSLGQMDDRPDPADANAMGGLLQGVAGEQLRNQVEGMEAAYRALLAKVDAAAKGVCGASYRVQLEQRRLEELLDCL